MAGEGANRGYRGGPEGYRIRARSDSSHRRAFQLPRLELQRCAYGIEPTANANVWDFLLPCMNLEPSALVQLSFLKVGVGKNFTTENEFGERAPSGN